MDILNLGTDQNVDDPGTEEDLTLVDDPGMEDKDISGDDNSSMELDMSKCKKETDASLPDANAIIEDNYDLSMSGKIDTESHKKDQIDQNGMLAGSIYVFGHGEDTDILVEILRSGSEITDSNFYPEGYGFITFKDVTKADECVNKFDNSVINSHKIYVGKLDNISKLKEVILDRKLQVDGFPEYITLKMNPDFNPLKFKNNLEKECGKINRQNIKEQTKYSTIVRASSNSQARSLLLYKDKNGFVKDIFATNYLNQSKGVISSWILKNIDEKELIGSIPHVVNAQRIKRRIDGVLTNTNAIILTFNRPNVPPYVDIGWKSLDVKLYIPRVTQCFKCQAFGHTQTKCKLDYRKCVVCGDTYTEDHTCNAEPKCCNCGENHEASDRRCSQFIREKEILKLVYVEKVGFATAKERVQQSHPRKTFASALSKPNPSMHVEDHQETEKDSLQSGHSENSPSSEQMHSHKDHPASGTPSSLRVTPDKGTKERDSYSGKQQSASRKEFKMTPPKLQQIIRPRVPHSISPKEQRNAQSKESQESLKEHREI